MIIAEGPWCNIIIAEIDGELETFTSRAMFIARSAGQRVDYTPPVTPHDPWFHQLFINTKYVVLHRRSS